MIDSCYCEFLIGIWSGYQIFPPIASLQNTSSFLGRRPVALERTVSIRIKLEFKAWVGPLLAMHVQAGYLISLNFYFLFYKVGKLLFISQGHCQC